MKRVIALIVAMLFVLSVAGFAIAAEKKEAAPAEKKEAAPAEKKAPAKVKQVTGEVTAVDATAKTLTVKGKAGDVALTADDKTTVKIGKEKKALGDIKVGDKVMVRYAEMDGKNMAKSIMVKAAPAEKKEAAPKAEEKKPAEKK
ncbi:MAG: hypothetical protein ACK4Z9_04400 [Thermodesulfovibrionales bacterium]